MAAARYLEPYLKASRRFGGGFGSLLWASPKSQSIRFDTLARLAPPRGKTLLDAGCGRADYLDFLLQRGEMPGAYIGIENVAPLADVAEQKWASAQTRILRGDFVEDPRLLGQDANIIVFSGSLNTLEPNQMRRTLSTAWEAAREALAFNFLNSPLLAANEYLHWYQTMDVLNFCKALTENVRYDEAYYEGDCTMVLRK